MRQTMVVFLCSLLVVARTQAAGFDCQSARSAVESRICDDVTLSRLDEQLNETYNAAYERTADQTSLAQTERNWLHHQRDHCRDRACLAASYGKRIAELQAVKSAGWSVYRNQGMNVEFVYWQNGQIKPCPDQKNCVRLSYRHGWGQVDNLTIQVLALPLEATVAHMPVFRKVADHWVTQGSAELIHATQTIARPGLTGLSGDYECPMENANGFHRAAGLCISVVLSNGKRSITLSNDDTGFDSDYFQRTIDSAHFVR